MRQLRASWTYLTAHRKGINSMTKYIKLTRGKVAIVDRADYDRLARYSWCISGRYASSRISGQLIYMHRLLLNAPKGMSVDHINGDCFDNRRSNLRLATHRENCRNQKRHVGKTGYKGVYWRTDTSKWQAKIMVDYKSITLGCFTDEREAARAYDAAARLYFGEFARTNFDANEPLRERRRRAKP